MGDPGKETAQTCPALWQAPVAQDGEVILIHRSPADEEKIRAGAVTSGQVLEEEYPGLGQVKGSIRKRVLGGFVH